MTTATTRAGPVECELEVEDLTVRLGGVTAVDRVSLSVGAGEIVGLIGPNGAGKTTLFDAISGFVIPDSGKVRLAGRDATRLGPHRRARLGAARGFQDAGLFAAMAVRDVVAVAFERAVVGRSDLVGELLGLRSARRAERWVAGRVMEVIERFGLTDFADHLVGELSTGTRRIVELACLLAAEPGILLLDEPTAGIAQGEREALGQILADVRSSSPVSILLIEHDIPTVLALADHVVVMEAGRVIATGAPDEIARDPDVAAAYLGLAAGARR